MKFRHYFLALGLSAAFISASAQQTAMDAWKPLLSQQGMAEYFKGTFENLGVRIAETGEALTVHHDGSKLSMTSGIDTTKVDFEITIPQAYIADMKDHGNDNKIDDRESFLILRAIFTPITQDELNNKYLTQRKYVKVSGVDAVVHVTLLDPSKKEDYTQTVIFSENQWIAVPGHVGKAGSSLKLTPAQALEFQRKLFEASKTNTKKSWLGFANWYKDWKKTVKA